MRYSLINLLLYVFLTIFIISSYKLIHNSRATRVFTNLATTSIETTTSTVANKYHDILIRAYKGEKVERTPVWLMRQAGRYMKAFREYSEKYPFRQRSETPDIAIELSLQPWREFGVDGVIMFSDILTPLPSIGVDFTMVESKGPKIISPLRDAHAISQLKPIHDVDKQVPFLGTILKSLRKETEGKTSLIGFIGAPWTLAGYSVEGGSSKLCKHIKTMCYENPSLAHKLLQTYTDSLCVYASYQIESGAQILQIFESWAHHMSEEMFITFAKPYVSKIANYLKSKHPNVPVVYFANGGSAYLSSQLDLPVDALSLDWQISMKSARQITGYDKVLAGNVDPAVLYGSASSIESAVKICIEEAGVHNHVLNLGHGVEKDITEDNVRILVNAAQSYRHNI